MMPCYLLVVFSYALLLGFWAERKMQKKFVLWLLFVSMAFLVGTGVMLSIVQRPQLKVEMSPPGYPPVGESWKITVWENEMSGSGWVKSSNASVILFTETNDTYIFSTDLKGLVEAEYRPEYGKVTIEVVKEGFRGTSWIPAYRFIDLSIVIAFYTIFIAVTGATIKVISGFFKFEKRLSNFTKFIGYTISAMQVVATFLASRWFWDNYQTGRTWGFNSVIWTPLEFEHLIFLSGSLMVSMALFILIKTKWKEESWSGLKEEWQYLECKITVLGTLAMLSIILTVVFTGLTFSFSPIYSHIFTSFVSLIAIVPSVSLAVIEISTSGYSVKFARVYRKSVYFWYLLVIYTVIILISAFGLLYPNTNAPMLNTITPILSGFGISYLIPYFLAMIRLLDPKKAIGKLGQQINLGSLISIIKRKTVTLVPPPEDPLFPMTEMGIKAIREGDIEMLQLTLREFVRRYSQVLGSLEKVRPQADVTFGEVATEVVVSGRMQEIIEHFINHLRSIKDSTIKERYEQAVSCVIEYFNKFAKETMKYRFIEAHLGNSISSYKWIYEIYLLGEVCLYLSFWDGAASSLRALSDLSIAAMRNDYEGLQYSIAGLVKDLSISETKKPTSPKYFLPGVALHSMSDVVQSRMENGAYDFALEHEIEYMNTLSRETLKEAYYASGPILSRCYEKLLAVAFFDFYVSKGEEPGSVAKVIWDVFPFKFLYHDPLVFLVNDRSKRKIVFTSDRYSPEKVLKDLIRKGLVEAAKQAIILEKYVNISEICFTLQELSRTFYKFEDKESIKEVCEAFIAIYKSAENLKDFRIVRIPTKIFSMGYACTGLGLKETALDIISYLKSLTVFVAVNRSDPETSMIIASLVEYLGAAAIEINSMDVAAQALNAIIEFEEDYTKKIGALPKVNHVNLLVRRMKRVGSRFGYADPYFDDEKGWLYRLFGDSIYLEKPIMSEKALDQFYTMYLFRKLPSLNCVVGAVSAT